MASAALPDAATEDDWRAIVTQNMEGNDAILASSRTLGFEPSLGLRDLSYDFA